MNAHTTTGRAAPDFPRLLREMSQAAAARERELQDRISALEREVRALREERETLLHEKSVPLPEGCTREAGSGPAREINLVAWRGAKGNAARYRRARRASAAAP